MDRNISLIKALVNTLQLEVETLNARLDNDSFDEAVDLPEKVREYETNLIRTALVKTLGNQRQAAALLGLKASTLNAKIKQFGIRLFKGDQPEETSSDDDDTKFFGSNVERFVARG